MSRDTATDELAGCESVGELLTRRRELLSAGITMAALGVSGCLGGGGGAQTATEPPQTDEEGHEEELPEGVSEEAFESGPVPEVYQRAKSLGGEERNPDDVMAKADVNFSEFDEAQEIDAHGSGECCANCADYIADKNGDTFGACAEVGGYIDGADWCTVYETIPEPSVPEGMSEDELATAEVPGEYRTATSQGDEERDPDDLRSQEDVNLTESAEAIGEETAQPGQSCGNCADFIPDKNGDGWGACAEVEGHIASEDWCVVWEQTGEEH
ncbi:high-potential iron-sulfur protein [Halobellus ordinarius]|uniref:high-potential iron-sulfur protein n=1 Tax=Halobellus ordinarius TaxID=3075120 RepID=UPI0028805AB6|nr:high-potential iron-sulfur protein [Halobellus sp. ZY16]